MSKLLVTQTVSVIARPHTTRAVIKGLRLRGPGSTVVVAHTPSFRGMSKKVLHLGKLEEKKT